MSRLAKKPIQLASGVTLKQEGGVLAVKGSRGEQKIVLPQGVQIRVEGDTVWVSESSKDSGGALVGTVWSLITNAIRGVSEGFSKVLEIEGVGYRAALEGKEILLFLGYTQPVRMKIPEGITIAIEKNAITISGIDKNLVGLVASNIRSHKKPEPYKGKGIHYKGEVIKRKVGKKAGATATA